MTFRVFLHVVIYVFLFGSLEGQISKLDSMKTVMDSISRTKDPIAFHTSKHRYEALLIKAKLIDEYCKSPSYLDVFPNKIKEIERIRYISYMRGFYIKKYCGDLITSLDHYLHAAKLIDGKLNDRPDAWIVEKEIGDIYAQLNEYDKALSYYFLVEKSLIKSQNTKNLIRLYTSISDIYKWTGSDNKALSYLDLAYKLSDSAKFPKSTYAIHVNIASIYLDKRDYAMFDKEVHLAELNFKKIEDSKDRQITRTIELLTLRAEKALAQNRLQTALSFYKKCAILRSENDSSKSNRNASKVNLSIAKIYNDLKQIDSCKHYIKKGFKNLIPDFNNEAIPKEHQLFDENTLVDLLLLRSKLYVSQYDRMLNPNLLDSSLISIDLALTTNTYLDNRLLVKNSQLISSEIHRSLIDQALITLSKYNSENSIDLTLVERYFLMSKSRVLRRYMGYARSKVNFNQEDKEHLLRLDIELISLLKETNTEESHEKFIKLKEESHNLYKKYTQQSIPQGYPKSFIDYVKVDSQLFIFTDLGAKKFYALNVSDLDNSIKLFNQCIAEKTDGEEFTKVRKKIKEQILPFDIPEIESITILADGQLHSLPFELIVESEHDKDFTYKINYGLQNEEIVERKRSSKIFCLNPQYPQENRQVQSIERGDHYHLPFANVEVKQISKTWENQIKRSTEIDIFQFKSESSDCSILHFTGHAIAKEDSAYLVVINRDKQIEYIDLNRLEHISDPFDLVTLSACETGLGKYNYGEGISSIANSFLSTGSEAVVYTLWTVNDESTSKIMGKFYEYLSKGERKSNALFKAKMDYLDSAPPTASHPYYWAGIVLNGSDVPLQKKKNHGKYIPLLILSLLLGSLLFKAKTKQT